jgi:hypothetical protein
MNWRGKGPFGFHTMWGISWLDEKLLASQEGLCAMASLSVWIKLKLLFSLLASISYSEGVGGVEIQLHPFLISALNWSCLLHAPAILPLGKPLPL